MAKRIENLEEKQKREQEYLSAFNKLYFISEQEKEAKYLGIVLSNKIDRSNPQLSNCLTYEQFLELENDKDVIIAGFITDMSLTKSKKGKMYGLIKLSDELFNDFELITTEKNYLSFENRISNGNLVILKGKKMDNIKLSLNKDNIYKIS